MINFNPLPSYPEMADVLNMYGAKLSSDLNCHAIATIQSLNTTALTVSAQINYTRTLVAINPLNGTYTFSQVPYPLLSDIPLVIMGGGNASLTFPIQQGDQCLLLFNDRDMDNWFSGARTGPVNSNRLHHLSDAIAIVGLIPNLPTAYSTTHAILQKGQTKIGVSDSKVLITNSAGKTLNDILQDLVTAIENLTVLPGTFTAGITPVTGTGTVQSTGSPDLSSVASELGALLE